MEDRPGVSAVLGVLDEIADVVRRGLGQQVDDDGAELGLEDRLLAAHLRDRQRRREETRAGLAQPAAPASLRRRSLRKLRQAKAGLPLVGEGRCRQQQTTAAN